MQELHLRDEKIESLEEECSIHKIKLRRLLTQDRLAYFLLSAIALLTLMAVIFSFIGIDNNGLNLIKDVLLMLLSAFNISMGGIYGTKKMDEAITSAKKH